MHVQKQTVSVVSTNMKTKQKWRKRTVLYPSRYFFIRYCIQHIFNTDAIFSIWLSQVTYKSTNKESKIYTDFLIT